MNKNLMLLLLCLILTGCATTTQFCKTTRLQSHQRWLSDDKLYSIYRSFHRYTGKHDPADPDCNLIRIARAMIAKGYPYFSIVQDGAPYRLLWLDDDTFVAGEGATAIGYLQRPQKGELAKSLSLHDERIFDTRKTISELSNKLGSYKHCKGDLQYRECL